MVFFKSDNIISSLGFGTTETFAAMLDGETGIKPIYNKDYYPEIFQASMIGEIELERKFDFVISRFKKVGKYTKLEKMLIVSVDDALAKTDIDITSVRTGIILSTTKGNINLLEKNNSNSFSSERVLLWKLGNIIQEFFSNPNITIVVSNACISGVLAINTAAMYINSGMFDNVVVTGGDIVSKFVVSGFMSFLSLSPNACKPFDKNRDGLSLGEAAGTIILGSKSDKEQNIIFRGGATANDANHISGPSRTAEGSYIAIKKSLKEAGIHSNEINHISAHGTATPYNDEMESLALNRHDLLKVSVNSIKGYLGHTLGAAGIIETAILLEEMRTNTILKTAGYEQLGVSQPINIVSETTKKELVTCLKMASGFGGSNAAMLISKYDN